MRNFDSKYMKMAQIWASNSYAKRNKVGALIVKDGMIISDGFNGTPSGFENECEKIKESELAAKKAKAGIEEYSQAYKKLAKELNTNQKDQKRLNNELETVVKKLIF